MFDALVGSVMACHRLLTASPRLSVIAAAQRMKRRKVGALLIVDRKELTGILTERDITFRVVAPGLDPATTRVDRVMTRSPVTIGPHERFGYALLVMHENGFRHLPVVEQGLVIGVVSARNALDPALEEFACEADRRAHLMRRRSPRPSRRGR